MWSLTAEKCKCQKVHKSYMRKSVLNATAMSFREKKCAGVWELQNQRKMG